MARGIVPREEPSARRVSPPGAYRPVVRNPIDETGRGLSPELAFTPMGTRPSPSLTAWYQLLSRPWSWKWKRILLGGAAVCMALGLLSTVCAGLLPFYAAAMALWIPAAIVMFFHELDIRREVSGRTVILVAVIGGGVTVFLAEIANQGAGIDSERAFLAAMTEEPIKALMLFSLAMFPKRFRGVSPGLVLGAAIGAGFAVIETFEYAYMFGEGGRPSTTILFVRGALSPFMHLAWTGALGGAMWATRGDRNGFYAWASVKTWGVFVAMIALHIVWNSIGPIQYLSLALWALIIHYAKRGVRESMLLGALPRGIS